MSEKCEFCPNPLNPYDLGVYKQVAGWVSGPKADGMVLREETGKYAHRTCIEKMKAGQLPEQPELDLS